MRLLHRNGERLGRWLLQKPLGTGGNAEVWEALGDQGQVVALKILRSTSVISEPYVRFRNEISVLRRLCDPKRAWEGLSVLPIIDVSLPDRPSRTRPAWLAMPVAMSIRAKLGNFPELKDVVKAVRSIAATLATLADEGICHRDIKPSNLYWYEDDYVVGDFGLVDYPGKEDITSGSRWLGPLHFLAPEMLMDPGRADGLPADVYSLAKTMWVLATTETWPPPGEIRRDIKELNLADYTPHPMAQDLDEIIEACTKHTPEARLTMFQLFEALITWETLLRFR